MTYIVTTPADTGSSILAENAKIRQNWVDLKSNINVDHYPMDDTFNGKHRKVTLYETTMPANVANAGIIYTKDDTGTELFYEDDSGTETQISKDGKLYMPGNKSPKGVVVAWAYTNSAGVLQEGYNLTSALVGSSHQFTFSDDLVGGMANTNYCIIANSMTSTLIGILPANKLVASFTLTPLAASGINVVVLGTPA